jgi:formamidopyrimidine-DNA glycosylase
VPELPDITVYCEALAARVVGAKLLDIRLQTPFLLRSVEPPLTEALGQEVRSVERLGKRIVFSCGRDLHLVLHLMIAGRLRWYAPGGKIPAKIGLAAFDFSTGTLVLTEAGTKRRASLFLLRGRKALRALDPGGLEVLEASPEAFAERMWRENRTLKRTLTDPRILSGIGNSFSDEILHSAGLSPFRQTRQLSDAEMRRLYQACRHILTEWTDRLRRETGDGFPEKVTAFRDGMAVHGRYRQPCPDCGSPVQRVVYAENEANYCARCQTEGRLLADRALSRLLKSDWPKTLEELEERRRGTDTDSLGAGPG